MLLGLLELPSMEQYLARPNTAHTMITKEKRPNLLLGQNYVAFDLTLYNLWWYSLEPCKYYATTQLSSCIFLTFKYLSI